MQNYETCVFCKDVKEKELNNSDSVDNNEVAEDKPLFFCSDQCAYRQVMIL